MGDLHRPRHGRNTLRARALAQQPGPVIGEWAVKAFVVCVGLLISVYVIAGLSVG